MTIVLTSCKQEKAELTPAEVALARLDSIRQSWKLSAERYKNREDSVRAVEDSLSAEKELRKREQASKPPDVTITADEWYASYQTNEAQANRLYVDKTIEVTGIVEKVTSTNGGYRCYMKAGEWLGNVVCEFDNEDDAASLSAGQKVTFIGTGTPKVGYPEIVECRLKK